MLAAGTFLLAAVTARTAAAAPVYLEIYAEQDRSSPDPLEPFDVHFILHANGNKVQGVVIGGVLRFTNGNIIGTIEEWPNGDAQIIYSAQSVSTFHSIAWNQNYGRGYDPDSLLLGLTSIHNPQFDTSGKPWMGTGELFRIHVSPNDSGTFWYDSLMMPLGPGHGFIMVADPTGSSLETVVVGPPIHVPPQPGPVRFRISTSSGTDTLFFGVPGTIYFNVDAMGNEILGLDFGFKWVFSNDNFIGPFSDVTGEVQYSPTTVDIYESIVFGPYSPKGSNPDTCLVGLLDFGGGERFSGSTWMWSVTFQPIDTGTVIIDCNFMHPPAWVNISALDFLGGPLPVTFIPGRIVVVPCPYELMGDVNQDAVLTSSDLICFVNYIFKSGPDPLPHRSVGDVNCSGGLGASDLIYLVNYIFKSGAAPCACTVKRI